MKQILAALCITLTLGIFPAFAAPPATITYQGYLTNSGGTPVNGSVAMILSLYDAAGNVTNTPLWSESQPAVSVTNGVYTVQLGSISALNLPFDTTYYLGVAVGGESEMTPRLTLTSAPTVFRAMNADSADKLNQPCGNGQMLMYASASSSWGCITPGALATRDTIADAVVAPNAGIATSKLSGAVTAITNHGLGSAATLNAGPAAGNLVQLDGSAKLPAVDGSQLIAIKLPSDANGNVKAGDSALNNNTTGDANTAIGTLALVSNTAAGRNTAIGFYALINQNYSNGGSLYAADNTAVGFQSLVFNNPTSAGNGIGNTALGSSSLVWNTTGRNNIGIGYLGGYNLTTGNYNIDIGNMGVTGEGNTIRIGDSNQTKTFIAGIEGAAGVNNPKTVVIDPATGQLGSAAITAAPSAATTVTTQAYSDAGTVGTATAFAREDHKHAFPASTKDTTAATGILKGNGTAITAAVAGDFPTLNQNTTGTAANVTGTVAVANGGTGATDASSARTALGLGTAATFNVGTVASNVVQLNGSAQLPAVDGSLLTGVKLLSFGVDYDAELETYGPGTNSNTAGGTDSLPTSTSGYYNTAFGASALTVNNSGRDNTAIGYFALYSNTNGIHNSAFGSRAMQLNTTGSYNTAFGDASLITNTAGSHNIALGDGAGGNLVSGSNNIFIGNAGIGNDSNLIRIGDGNQTKAFISGIRGVGSLTGTQSVVIDANGQLGSVASTSGTVTNVTVGSGLNITNGSTTPNITLGTVPVANGGTGASTLTGYVKGSGTSAMTASATIPNTDISGLGTAAALNVGSAANNIVKLDGSAKLPAVDGSQLTAIKLLSDAILNVKAGSSALNLNTAGFENIAIGTVAMSSNTVASRNVAIGSAALNSQSYDSGSAYSSYNTAVGYQSMSYNNPISTSTGVNNTALGALSLFNNNTGKNNIGIGWQAGLLLTTGDYNIDIGNSGVAGEGNTIRIGDSNQTKTFISGIRGVGSLTGTQSVVIDASGQLGSVASSAGTVTGVTASGVLASSGGAAPDISLTGVVPVANGGTGAATLTGYVKGSGTSTMTASTTIPATDLSGTLPAARFPATLPAVDGSLLTNVQLLSDLTTYSVKGGSGALANNTPTGFWNTAYGYQVLNANSTGVQNLGIGAMALALNTVGKYNIGVGLQALYQNLVANDNIAIGNGAMISQTFPNSGVAFSSANIAIGNASLANNNPTTTSTGINNVAVGYKSMWNNTTGANNIALGFNAGNLLTIGNYNIDIGNSGVAGEGNTIRIGDGNQNKTFISGIRGVGSLTGTQSVVIDASGQLGTLATAGRFVTVPATATTACTTGDFSADGGFIYVCYTTNVWRRSVAATW